MRISTKYNGKELQDELGVNVYDYGNRNYDPTIGRFFNMDRFSEKQVDNTPYQGKRTGSKKKVYICYVSGLRYWEYYNEISREGFKYKSMSFP